MSLIKGLRPSRIYDTNFQDTKLSEIGRASSAAYPFLAATVIKGSQFVDGGFLFNNADIICLNFLLN